MGEVRLFLEMEEPNGNTMRWVRGGSEMMVAVPVRTMRAHKALADAVTRLHEARDFMCGLACCDSASTEDRAWAGWFFHDSIRAVLAARAALDDGGANG